MMLTTQPNYKITWEKLPDDFVLPDDPVDNINQPALAAALTESLLLAGRLGETALTSTNYGICVTIDGKFAVKAPDWAYIPALGVDRSQVIRSYTPKLQGEQPAIVLEFLSDTEGGEYSVKETFPVGKFFFYEQILQVPNYGIFNPETGHLELYRFNQNQRYQIQTADAQGRFWIPEMQLFLGVWRGSRENPDTYWLRWWDAQQEMLLWGTERVALEQQRADQEQQRANQEQQRADQEQQRANQEQQRADRLAAQLRAAGIEPEI